MGSWLILLGIVILAGAAGLLLYETTRPQTTTGNVPVPTSSPLALLQPTATSQPELEPTPSPTTRRPTATATKRAATSTPTAQADTSATPSPSASSTPSTATSEPTATSSGPSSQPPPDSNNPPPPAQEVPQDTAEGDSTVTHVSVPAAGVDTGVVEIGYDLIEIEGQTVIEWNVAQWAAGHHSISANPGEGSNVVLAAHVAGYGDVFRNLEYAEIGDEVVLSTTNGEYRYQITEIHLRLDLGVPLEERLATGAFMDATSDERVTLVTCWPYDVYDHRLIVIADPV